MAEEEHEHIVPVSVYLIVLVLLMVLLVLTLIAAFADLDDKFHVRYLNVAVAVLIAMCKAFLIMLFFMHVKYSSRVVWAFAGAAFVWLGIMMTLSLSDYVTRSYPPGGAVAPPAPAAVTIEHASGPPREPGRRTGE